MSTWVRIEDVSHKPLEGYICEYRKLVGSSFAAQFPMLAYVATFGRTTFNYVQVYAIVSEVERIEAMVSELGAEETLRALDALKTDIEALDIAGWDPERDLPGLLSDLKELCAVVHAKPHRYLVFLGD